MAMRSAFLAYRADSACSTKRVRGGVSSGRLVNTALMFAMLVCLSLGQVAGQEPNPAPQDKEVQSESPKLKVPVPPVGESVDKLNASHENFKRAFAGLKSVKLPSKQATLEEAR